MAKAAGIIFSSLNKNTLSRLTANRTVAAIPFACRYRLIDFCLSNMVNSDISDISIVANYNYRSLLDHIGSGKDWDLARRARGVNIVSPFQCDAGLRESKIFSTHLEALRSMSGYISEMSAEYVVLMDSDTVLNIDLSDVIGSHESSGSDITIVTRRIKEDFTSKNPRMMIRSDCGRIKDIAMSDKYDRAHEELSLGILVMRTLYLRKIVEEAAAYNNTSLTGFMLRNCKKDRFSTYEFTDYCAIVSSFLDYYRCSMELCASDEARNNLFGKKNSPIYTRVHNSSPKLYKKGAVISRSILADESIVEGTVINSVIFRGVRIGRGAVVKNSVLFHGTHVGDGAELNCIVTDKDVYIGEKARLSGNENMPFYIQKGRRV